MKLQVFVLFDKKAGYYMQPYFAHNAGVATRSFSDLVLKKEGMVSTHPEDYSLYCLGTYDDNAGTFENSPKGPAFIANAVDFVPQKKEA